MPEPTSTPALSVSDLRIWFDTRGRTVTAVDGIDFDVAPGRVLAIVGESGSGKSVTGLACLGLLADNAGASGTIMVAGYDMVAAGEAERNKLRGYEIAMVFQDALASLNPYATIGRQVADAYRVHHPQASKAEARNRTIEALGLVGLPDPARRAEQYPHEFSGGMRQRAMIAMAIVNEPRVLIADEPTTALDVTVQAQVLATLTDLTQRLGMAMVLVTHDLGVVAETADDVLVMYAGRVAETGTVLDIFERPGHPYTRGLLDSTPDPEGASRRLRSIPGVPASATHRPSGCPFHPRCPYAARFGERCVVEVPLLTERPGDEGHVAACHLSGLVADHRPGSAEVSPEEERREAVMTGEPGREPVDEEEAPEFVTGSPSGAGGGEVVEP